ncbi:MAG: periplasmic heavy metal sensor [Alphaproteobacteria bacterium]
MTRNRLLALALFVSVAVNIFAASVFLGPAFRQGPSLGPMTGERYLGSHGERHGERHGLDLHQLEHLSDASQQKVRAIWRDSRRDLHREFRASIKARRGLTEALTAETYDAQAVMAAQAALDAAMGRVRALTNQAVLDSASVLSDEEREEFFKRGFRTRHGKQSSSDDDDRDDDDRNDDD